MHLSRLWTDTQVQENNQNRERRSETGNKQGKKRKSTSAPVTSMDRHTSTEEKNRRVNQKRETGTKMCSVGGKGVRVHLSRLWTDTQVRNLGRKCPRLAPVETNLKKNVKLNKDFVQCSWTLVNRNSVQKIWT